MQTINRAAAVIKPKQPFVDWINAYPDSGGEVITLEEAQEDCTVILIPDFDYLTQAYSFIKKMHAQIFELELGSWYTDVDYWPEKRDLKTFNQWFEVEIHSTVIDPINAAIHKEPYYL